MKNLMTLFAVILFAFGGFSQTAKVEGTQAELKSQLAKNRVEFILPTNVTAEKVSKSAAYYTDYFSVNFDAKTHKASLEFVKAGNMDMSHRVVTRFLLSCGIRNVNFDGKDYTIMQFYSNFMRIEPK